MLVRLLRRIRGAARRGRGTGRRLSGGTFVLSGEVLGFGGDGVGGWLDLAKDPRFARLQMGSVLGRERVRLWVVR